MKKCFYIAIVIALVFTMKPVLAGEKVPKKIVAFAKKELVKTGTDPILVKAAKDQNAKDRSLADIKAFDKKFQNADENSDLIKPLVKSKAAKHLAKLQKLNDEIEEVYLLDNQGAIVATIKVEEQYYWGKHKGFAKAIKGDLWMGVEQDDDAGGEFMAMIYVPVKDNDKVVGVVAYTIELDD